MPADVVQLTEDIASYIDASVYSYRFTVSREHIAFVRLEETNDTRVFVYPSTIARSRESRDLMVVEAEIIVHVANYIDTQSTAEIDNGIRLTQEIERSFDDYRNDGWTMSAFTSDVTGRPAFQIEGLGQRNYFHTTIGMNFLAGDV